MADTVVGAATGKARRCVPQSDVDYSANDVVYESNLPAGITSIDGIAIGIGIEIDPRREPQRILRDEPSEIRVLVPGTVVVQPNVEVSLPAREPQSVIRAQFPAELVSARSWFGLSLRARSRIA